MKKFLPIFFVFLFLFLTVFPTGNVFAQVPTPTDFVLPTATPVPGAPRVTPTGTSPITSGVWVVDPEVTFIGKNAKRAGLLLDWTLQNYNWVCITRTAARQCDDRNNPLSEFWKLMVLYIVVPLLILVILATSVVIIITRGRSLTIMRFIPRFIAVMILVVFSYSLLQFFYQFVDLIQGFFLRSVFEKVCPPDCISQKDLLYIGWDYQTFVGLRMLGDFNTESAFMSLLLTKLTALTYYVMSGILLVRKIILWFFIIVSPIFPILLMYYPVRNTAKIWIGEFFRWMLYAPLFAIFLHGLVFLWRSRIPLIFSNPDINNPNAIIFPTAVNILLGGPQQHVTPNNSVNLTETFALYVVALIMLWIVILLPWVLLQIFLDYANNLSAGDSSFKKMMMNMVSNKQAVPPPVGYPPTNPSDHGATINLPFAKKFQMPTSIQPTGAAKSIPIGATFATIAQPISMPTAQVSAQMVSLAGITLPTMRDIAKYDTALTSRDRSRQREVTLARDTLEKISNPIAVTSTMDKQKFSQMRDRLVQSSQQGNLIASSVLKAANQTTKVSTTQLKSALQQISNPANVTSQAARDKMTKLHESLEHASKDTTSQLVSTLLSVNEKTSETEIQKIQEKLQQIQAQGNLSNSSAISTINNAIKGSQSITQTKNILQQVANPASITNATEKEKFTKLHDSLQKATSDTEKQLVSSILQVNDSTSVTELEKIQERLTEAQQQGSILASSVLNTINSKQQQSSSNVRSVLQQVANPASITNVTEREKFTKLHDSLQKSTSDTEKQLASSILQVNDSTSVTELEKIQERLTEAQQQGSILASSVLSTVNSVSKQQQSATNVRSVLQQVANPEAAKTINKERYSKLHDALSKASERGDTLAQAVLKVSDKTEVADITLLKDKIMKAQQAGQPLASELADMTKEDTGLPAINRIQKVSQQDFEEVKKMWKENYHNLEVPQGMAGTRSDWMKDDIGKIDSIISKLSSSDAEQNTEGMNEVSNILPFLMVGGFSQTEVIAYLRAKQEAAKDVLSEVTTEEEETTIDVSNKKTTQASQTMTASVSDSTPSTSSSSSDEDEGPTIADQIAAGSPAPTIVTPVIPKITNNVLASVNVKLPTLRDVARYETGILSKDKTKLAEVARVKEVLGHIANPAPMAPGSERQQYESLRDRLMIDSQHGDATAAFVLSAAAHMSQHIETIAATLADIKSVLLAIANPTTIASVEDKDFYTRLHTYLEKQQQEKQSPLAAQILAVTENTTTVEVQKIQEELLQAKEENADIIAAINRFVQLKQSKSLFQTIGNPSSIVSVTDKATFTKLHDSVKQASGQGNALATSLLGVTAATSETAVEKLQKDLSDASQKGDKLAQTILSVTPASVIPATNNTKTVSEEDYAAVKNLWEENYRSLPVPTPFTNDVKGRVEWIKNDRGEIEKTIELLNEPDTEKKNEGMKRVSEILPFLLLGGFSMQEITSYLSAKSDAATDVLAEIEKDEAGKVSVGVNTTTQKAEQTMSATVEEKDTK